MKLIKRLSITLILLFVGTFSLYSQGPELIAPLNMDNCLDTTEVIFLWHPTTNADDYRIEISKTANFDDIVIDEGAQGDTTYTAGGLETNQTYYWRVFSIILGTPPTEEESQTWNFRTLKDPPAHVQPIDNNTCVTKTYLFKWNTITNGTYNFQLSLVSDFSSIVDEQSGLTDTSLSITLPQYNQRYYWRVQSEYDGCITFFSAPDSFITQRQPATLSSPDDNAHSVSEDGIMLSWTAATAPTNYILQVSNDSTFSSVLHEYIGTNTSDSVSGLTTNMYYYWRVRMDYNDCYTEWTPFRTFRTEYQTPENLVPRKDSFCVPLVSRLRWDAVFEAITYRVQISEVGDFSTTVLDSSGIDIYYMNYVFPKAEQVYYWRVKAEDPNNSSKWSETTWFTTAIGFPERLTPVDGSDNMTQTVLFKWNKSNIYSTERLQVSDDSSFQRVLFDKRNLSQDSIYLKLPDQFVTYYWRINSEINLCVSTWSNVWSLRTVLLPPDLTYPDDGATNQSFALFLEWDAAEGAVTYDYHMALEPTFTNIIKGKTGIPGTEVYVSQLEPSTTYFWRVNSNNEGGQSVWSETFSFTTAAMALDVPVLLSPYQGKDKIPVNKVDLIWHPVDRASKYTIQVADNKDFDRPIINQPDETDTVYTLTAMDYGTKYFWRVMAENDSLQSSWSSAWAFSTVIKLPTEAPVLVSPADNFSPAPTEMTFEWEKVDRAENYELEVAYDEQFTDFFLQDTNVFQTNRYINNIDFEETFFWRVRAKNYSGKGPWSETRTFATLINSVDEELAEMYEASISPNPVTGLANLQFTLPKEANVNIVIYNAAGNRINILRQEFMSAGIHTIAIDSRDYNSGAYFANIMIDNRILTLKFVINK